MSTRPVQYAARLGALLVGADETRRWRLVAEFLEEYRWEPPEKRVALLDQEPFVTGDERWDVFLAALAEHLAAKDGRGAPVLGRDTVAAAVLVPVQYSYSGRSLAPR
ncbi:hypothetical protein [Micromonospora sp. CPCC 206061]|uniref:hypothetical protein n=1 Tax=Micromonospora sp. CPCC 206061 TaxID=3122410 RepID=UPI002FF1CFE4